VDTNQDGRNDYLDFQLTFPLQANEMVQNIRLAFYLQYKLEDTVPLTMESLAIVDQSIPLPVADFMITGDLVFKQRQLLDYWPRSDYNQAIVDWSDNGSFTYSATNTTWSRLISSYADRSGNLSTYI
jgi:hypothetical protein